MTAGPADVGICRLWCAAPVMPACRSWLVPWQEPGQQPVGSSRPARPVADGSPALGDAFTE